MGVGSEKTFLTIVAKYFLCYSLAMIDKNKILTEDKNCIECGEKFTINLQDHRSMKRSLCSEKCKDERKNKQYEDFIIRRREKKGLSLYADCLECGENFFKGAGRGHHARVCCSKECSEKRAKFFSNEQHKKMKLKAGICKISGCRSPALRNKFTVCEAHYCMHRRTGSYEGKIRNPRATDGTYVRIIGKGSQEHPMASQKSKVLYEHRMVAYDSRNGVCEECFWCGKELTWESCVIDHLNEHKHDNRPENLLISCTHCNRARGAMLGFIARMKTDSLPIFYEAISEYRKEFGTFKK